MVQYIQYCSYLFFKKYECIKKLLISIATNLYDIIYKIKKILHLHLRKRNVNIAKLNLVFIGTRFLIYKHCFEEALSKNIEVFKS